MRSQLLVALKEYPEAQLEVQKMLSDDQRNPDALTLRAHIGYITDAYTLPQIQQLLTNALAYDPDNKRAIKLTRSIKALELMKQKGNEVFSVGLWDDCEVIYGRCIEADLDCGVYTVKALSNRANVRSKVIHFYFYLFNYYI